MAARLGTVVIDCADPQAQADFWAAVLGWTVVGHEDDGAIEIGPGQGAGPTLLLQPSADPKVIKNRLHLDVNPLGCDQAAELERLIGLGATPVDIGQGDVSWIVLADPEGNEFCLLRAAVER